jgi:hypothetical protein
LPLTRYAETTVSAAVGGWRLVAKYDLVAIAPGERAVIVDWKTYRTRPTRPMLAGRLQTRVYPYLLVRARHELGEGHSLHPCSVEMVYWFANFASQPERFPYDQARFKADEVYLLSLISEITDLDDDRFAKTEREAECSFCAYAQLCQRGPGVPTADALFPDDAFREDDLDGAFFLDFEQIAEVEY